MNSTTHFNTSHPSETPANEMSSTMARAPPSNRSNRVNFWNPSRTLVFVRAYAHYEFLWNLRHPNHANRAAREAAYDALSRVLGKPILSKRMVVQKITMLRSRYNKRRTLCSRRASNGVEPLKRGGANHPDWYTAMDAFMSTTATSSGNKPPSAAAAAAAVAQQSNDDSGCNNDGHINDEESNTTTHANTTPPSTTATTTRHPQPLRQNSSSAVHQQEPSSSTTTESARIARQLQILQKLDQTVQQSMHEMRSLAFEAAAATNRQSPIDSSEFGAFGRHVAAQLSELPIDAVATCLLEVQTVLTRHRQMHERQQQQHQQQLLHAAQQQADEQQQQAQRALQQQQERLFLTIRSANDGLHTHDASGIATSVIANGTTTFDANYAGEQTVCNSMSPAQPLLERMPSDGQCRRTLSNIGPANDAAVMVLLSDSEDDFKDDL